MCSIARILSATFLALTMGSVAACAAQAEKTYGLKDSDVICHTCTSDVLAAKTAGINAALDVMIQQIGDILPRQGKVTFHLDLDQTCTDAFARVTKSGMSENSCFVECQTVSNTIPDVCNVCYTSALNQDLATMRSLAGQVLPIHEAGHVWWKGREVSYLIEEPMVQILSYVLSGDMKYCTEHNWAASPRPLTLVGNLCSLGITTSQIIKIYTLTASVTAKRGGPLTDEEFISIVSVTLGTDTRPFFVKAGIAPAK